MIGKTTLINWLRQLARAVDADILPVIRIAADDYRFAWHTLSQCTNGGYPGIDVGQDGDCRYPTDGAEGLHAHVFANDGIVEFHLDDVDVCRDPLGHALEDTHLATGALVGTLLGVLIGGAIGGEKGALIGAIAGGGGGAALSAGTPKRQRQVFHFHDLLAHLAHGA